MIPCAIIALRSLEKKIHAMVITVLNIDTFEIELCLPISLSVYVNKLFTFLMLEKNIYS